MSSITDWTPAEVQMLRQILLHKTRIANPKVSNSQAVENVLVEHIKVKA